MVQIGQVCCWDGIDLIRTVWNLDWLCSKAAKLYNLCGSVQLLALPAKQLDLQQHECNVCACVRTISISAEVTSLMPRSCIIRNTLWSPLVATVVYCSCCARRWRTRSPA